MGFSCIFPWKRWNSLTKEGLIPNEVECKSHVEELEEVFKKFDMDGDGKISLSELGSVMGRLGHCASEKELQETMKEMDRDGDGFIDLNEFIQMNVKEVGREEALANLKEAFSVYDIDGNGSISAKELREVLQSLGDYCTLSDCKRMISRADCDGDGCISFDEFRAMMFKGSPFHGGSETVPY